MIIVRGYDVTSRKEGKTILKIRFSGFSTLILNSNDKMEKYRKMLEKKLLNELEFEFSGIDVNLIFHEIHARTYIGKIITGFLDGTPIKEICENVDKSKEEVDTVIRSYLFSSKLLE